MRAWRAHHYFLDVKEQRAPYMLLTGRKKSHHLPRILSGSTPNTFGALLYQPSTNHHQPSSSLTPHCRPLTYATTLRDHLHQRNMFRSSYRFHPCHPQSSIFDLTAAAEPDDDPGLDGSSFESTAGRLIGQSAAQREKKMKIGEVLQNGAVSVIQ